MPQDERKPFIPAVLDEAGLSPIQFRVLCRICRRWDKKRGCDESVPNMAKGCGINKDTAWAALKKLDEWGFIQTTKRYGKTTRFDPLPVSNWWVPTHPQRGVIRKEGLSPDFGQGVSETKGHHLSETKGHEGISHKVLPKGAPKVRAGARDRWPCPPGVEPDLWGDWLQHRSEKRNALTSVAYSRQCNKLAAIKEAGRDPNAAIIHSLENGYTGIFEAKKGFAGRPGWAPQNSSDRRSGYGYAEASRDVEAALADLVGGGSDVGGGNIG